MNLTQAFKGYFYDKSATLSKATLAGYQYVFRNLVARLGDKAIEEVSANDLKDYILYIQNDYQPHRLHSTDTSPFAPASVDYHWKAVRSLFHWAYDAMDLPRPDLKMPRPRFRRAHVSAFTEEDIRKLVKACETVTVERDGQKHRQRLPTAHRDKALILTLLDTGLRVGELLRVQMRDVNFDTSEINVAPYGTGKKTKPRIVVLGTTARRAVWLYVARLEKERGILRSTDRLFPMTPVAVRLMLNRSAARAGLQNVHPHRFRHSFAIWYLRGGGDVFTLQRLLGHSSLEMVNWYLDIAQTDIAIAHRKSSALDRWNANSPF